MATKIYAIENQIRVKLDEVVPRFWTSTEIVNIIIGGIKDLWRDIADLKQEHFMTINEAVTLAADTATLTGVPSDVHKIIMISPLDLTELSANKGLVFRPAEYNSDTFQSSLSRTAIDATNDCVYYAITGAGSPVGAPTIRIAPQVRTEVELSFAYVPTLGTLTSDSNVPIPGEVDNALVAWGVAFARAKEREDKTPDPGWLTIYASEKAHILQSLGLRQYQEPSYVDALFQSYW